MKYFVLLILTICVSAEVRAQSKNLTKTDSLSFSEALKKYEKDKNLKFAYDSEQFYDRKVPISALDQDPDSFMTQILDANEFTYQFSGNTILIIPRGRQVLQNVSLTGIVRDELTGEPLPNAAVHLKESGQYVLTNRDGKFNFLKIPTDTSELEVRYLGYAINKFKISDLPKQEFAEIKLTNSPSVLSEITISDRKDVVFDIANHSSKVSVDIDEFKSVANYGEPDVFRSVQLLPGISATNETSSGLVIRGGLPEHNLILFDGFTVYHLDHFFGIFSAFNSNVIKDVQLYKGGYGAKYGSRISGVMDITGKTGNTLKPRLNLGMNLISSSLVAEVPISDKLSFLVAGRRSYTDIIQSGLYKKLFNHVRDNEPNSISPSEVDFTAIEPEFYFFDVNSKVTYRPDDDNLFSLSFYNGRDNLFLQDEFTDSEEEVDFFFNYSESLTESNRWGNEGLSFRYARQWNNKLYTELSISGSNFFRNTSSDFEVEFETDSLFEAIDVSTSTQNDVAESRISIDGDYRIDDSQNLTFGLFSVENDIKYINDFDDQFEEENLRLEEKGGVDGFYFQYGLNRSNKSGINIGIRASLPNQTVNSIYWEPRVSVFRKVNENLNFKAAYGFYHQFVVNTSVLDPSSSQSSFWQLADDEDIPVLKASHYSAGFTYNKNGLVVDVEAFRKDIDGMALFAFDPIFSDLGDADLFDFGTGEVNGIDLLVKKKFDKYNGWLSYTLSSAKNKFDDINQGNFFPTDQDQRHELKFVNMYSTGNWDFYATWIYGTGKPYSPPIDSTISLENDFATDFFTDINVTSKNSLRLPDYHRLDLSAAYKKKFGSVHGTFGLNIINVYNRRNIRGYRFIRNFDTSNSGTIEQRPIKLLDFTPSIFVNLQF